MRHQNPSSSRRRSSIDMDSWARESGVRLGSRGDEMTQRSPATSRLAAPDGHNLYLHGPARVSAREHPTQLADCVRGRRHARGAGLRRRRRIVGLVRRRRPLALAAPRQRMLAAPNQRMGMAGPGAGVLALPCRVCRAYGPLDFDSARETLAGLRSGSEAVSGWMVAEAREGAAVSEDDDAVTVARGSVDGLGARGEC